MWNVNGIQPHFNLPIYVRNILRFWNPHLRCKHCDLIVWCYMDLMDHIWITHEECWDCQLIEHWDYILTGIPTINQQLIVESEAVQDV